MLNTNGGRFGGYGLYLLKSKPVFTYNVADVARFRWEARTLSPPASTRSPSTSTTTDPAWAVLKVDGTVVDTKKIPHTVPVIFAWDETFDVGSDSGNGVDDNDYQAPFRFTGKLSKLTVHLGPSQMLPPEKKAVEQKVGQRD